MPEGQGFIDYAKQSLLVKGILELGFFYETAVEREEKDYGYDEEGGPMIASFDIGHLYFTKEESDPEGFHSDDRFGHPGRDVVIYHSRFNDNWYIDIHGQRIMEGNLKLADMNNPVWVEAILTQIKSAF